MDPDRPGNTTCDCRYQGENGDRAYVVQYTLEGTGALHGNTYFELDGGYADTLRPEQVHVKVSSASIGADNPTPYAHGGFDFAEQKLVTRTPTGALRIQFPEGYDRNTWGVLYSFACAAPKTCTSLSVTEPADGPKFEQLRVGLGDAEIMSNPGTDASAGIRNGLQWAYDPSKVVPCPEGTLDYAEDPTARRCKPTPAAPSAAPT